MLRDLQLKPVYTSADDDLLNDFYLPSLSQAIRYDRAVGYFSASLISIATQGISALVERNGKMRLIIGASLEPEEANAINKGYLDRSSVERLDKEIIQTIEKVAHPLVVNRLEALSWLIATSRLDIKVALRESGMYHDKVGILADENDDELVFHGSANETPAALLPDFNFESIDIFPNWVPGLQPHFEIHKRTFEKLWSNETAGTLVIKFPDAARKKLLDYRENNRRPNVLIEKALHAEVYGEPINKGISISRPTTPEFLGEHQFGLRTHQRDALNAWRSSDFNGILDHATGSGKTVTAIYGATKLLERTNRLFLVIAVPYQNLADQWILELKKFGWSAVPCYRSRNIWEKRLRDSINRFTSQTVNFASCVVVNRTLQSESFLSMLNQLDPANLMFIGDECHHYGSINLGSIINKDIRFRLGLSATPQDQYSDAKTENIEDFFGPTIHEYSLKNALGDEVLTPYEYHVKICELKNGEIDDYYEINREISSRIVSSTLDYDTDEDETLKVLFAKRARILAHAEDKLDKLKALLKNDHRESLSLFYCGEGNTERDGSDISERHVHRVTKILDEVGLKSSVFTAQENSSDRKRILANFQAAVIDSIVAIRCLDEGIDVPACRSAYFLASSRNYRQFVQRRGRILRRAPGKNIAKIVDFVVTLPKGGSDTFEYERKLMRDELVRVVEFAKLATNVSNVYDELKGTLNDYGLEHMFVGGVY